LIKVRELKHGDYVPLSDHDDQLIHERRCWNSVHLWTKCCCNVTEKV